MNTIKITDISGYLFGIFDYDEKDDNYTKLEKLENVLNNNDTKNKCLENNKFIVLMNGLERYYINFIYLENDELHFSEYKCLSNDLINSNQFNIVFMDIPINISHMPITYININKPIYFDNSIENCNIAYFLININYYFLQYISHDCENYKEIVLSAVKNNGDSLEYASSELRADKEVVLEAVKNDGYALQYASKKLQADKDILLEAVKNDGYALQYASKKLQADKDILFEAVKNDPDAIGFASKKLLGNKDFVLEAVKNNGYALDFASYELQNDKDILFEAAKNNGHSRAYAPRRIPHEIIILY